MKPALVFAALIVIVLLAIALMKQNGATEHPLLVDAQALNIPPCAAVPMCKPQGAIDCQRPNTRSYA